MSRPSDHVGDFNPTYYFTAVESTGDPDYMKTASVLTPSEVDALPDHLFADQRNRLWPVHTKAATLMSACSFFSQHLDLPQVYTRIKQAAAAHNILADVGQAEIALAPAPLKQASGDSTQAHQFALIFEGEDNKLTHMYPCQTPGEVIKSARFLAGDTSEQRIPRDWARSAAITLVKRAAELGLPDSDIAKTTLELGTERIPDFDIAERNLDLRCKLAGLTAEEAGFYHEVLESAKAAYLRGEEIDEHIGLCEELDAINGIQHSAVIPDPHTMIFSGEKMASIAKYASSVVFLLDTPIPVDQVARLSATPAVHSRLTKEAASLTLKAAAQATSNPADATAIFARMPLEDQQTVAAIILG